MRNVALDRRIATRVAGFVDRVDVVIVSIVDRRAVIMTLDVSVNAVIGMRHCRTRSAVRHRQHAKHQQGDQPGHA